MSDNSGNQPQQELTEAQRQLIQMLMQVAQQQAGVVIPGPNLNIPQITQDDNIDDIITHIMNTDTSFHGNPPAAPIAIQEMDETMIDARDEAKGMTCGICTEGFKVGEYAKRFPDCKHWFHTDEIHEWLKKSNSCPMCRSELPTMSHDYEDKKREERSKKNQKESSYPDFMYL